MSAKDRFGSLNDWILPEFILGLIGAGIIVALGVALYKLIKPLLSNAIKTKIIEKFEEYM